jgi:hypothetical protein
LVGLLPPFYHNLSPVNKKFWQALSGDFDNRSCSDYSFNGVVDERNCQFKYTQMLRYCPLGGTCHFLWLFTEHKIDNDYIR